MSKGKCQGFMRCMIHYGGISTMCIIFYMLKTFLMAPYGSRKTWGARKNCCNRLFLYIKCGTWSIVLLPSI